MPPMRCTRIDKLVDCATSNRDPVLTAVVDMSRDLRKEGEHWSTGAAYYCKTVMSRVTREKASADALHSNLDGKGLSNTNEVADVSRWVAKGSRLMYINALLVGCGCLYTKSRAS